MWYLLLATRHTGDVRFLHFSFLSLGCELFDFSLNIDGALGTGTLFHIFFLSNFGFAFALFSADYGYAVEHVHGNKLQLGLEVQFCQTLHVLFEN